MLSVADDMSGLGSARPVRLSEAFWRVLDAPEGSRGGCAHGKVFEPSAPLGICGAQSERGGRVAGGERTDLPALDAGLARRRARLDFLDGRFGKALGQAGSERPGGRSGAALSRAPPRFHRQAFPRASARDHGFGWSYTWLKLHLQWKGRCRRMPRKGARPECGAERRPLPGMMLHQSLPPRRRGMVCATPGFEASPRSTSS